MKHMGWELLSLHIHNSLLTATTSSMTPSPALRDLADSKTLGFTSRDAPLWSPSNPAHPSATAGESLGAAAGCPHFPQSQLEPRALSNTQQTEKGLNRTHSKQKLQGETGTG